jgi:hypothetical protein
MEERMKNTCVVLCLLFLASSVALAQEKTNVQWKCDKPSVQHSIPVGDNVAVLHVFHEFTVAGYVVAPDVKKLGAEAKGNSDQSTSFDCTGTYTPATT